MLYVNGSAFVLVGDSLSFPAVSYTYIAPPEWWNVNGTVSWQHAADVSGFPAGAKGRLRLWGGEGSGKTLGGLMLDFVFIFREVDPDEGVWCVH